ncbi:two-component system sensor histidine kinase CreC [Caenimonas sedimenti]|uniref:histidine kinase n=1 Tax=Caenimonas sedimenti TaxID=2596921 RepID=A0A562ZQP5_9BURK|nr:two-component system sensor histidine kinase CreC [Caenimonas sedimenti]TWO70615.1 two-component system sensor histidine kinase CreC [Caenimonas sedimenti]
MSKRSRIFLGILLIYLAGTAFLLYRVLADLDPRYRESAEESLVETAQVMAGLVESDLRNGAIDTARLGPLFASVYARRFDAQIFSHSKQRVELRLFVVDATGRVLFDSRGQQAGADFSQWRDVRLALRGEYGARTTADIEDNPLSSVMYVAAPVRANGTIVGAVSVAKPVRSFGQFVEAARRKTLYVGILSAAAVLLMALALSAWLVRPFGIIGDFVRYVRAQRKLSLRPIGRRALGAIREAFEEMRDALAGRNYVADYVQTLTHELKSPLSAIRGATELLQEAGMDPTDRQRFLANIAGETQRIQEVVDRMMELTTLEARRSLREVQAVALDALLDELVSAAQASAAARQVRVVRVVPGARAGVAVEGDTFLLRRAVGNLLDNAIDFAPEGSEVRVHLDATDASANIRIEDDGPGIPGYAQSHLFEKFYSLPRPRTGRKSTGLGLSFVRQIATLHRGKAALENGKEGGAVATLSLPRLPSG